MAIGYSRFAKVSVSYDQNYLFIQILLHIGALWPAPQLILLVLPGVTLVYSWYSPGDLRLLPSCQTASPTTWDWFQIHNYRYRHNIWDAPNSKVHGANIGPTWALSAPDGPHVGPMNLPIRGTLYFGSVVLGNVANFLYMLSSSSP